MYFTIPRAVALYFTGLPHMTIDMHGNVYDTLNKNWVTIHQKKNTISYYIPYKCTRIEYSIPYLVRRAYYNLYDEYDEDDIRMLDFIHCSNYIVCCDGRVFNQKTWSFMKHSTDYRGYWRYTLVTNEGEKQTFQAHRLVALAFLENPKGYEIVDHKDGNPSNNHVSNLQFVSQKENVIRAMSHGRHPAAKGPMTSLFFGGDV